MNYNEVLNIYHPLEKGDFMYRYHINDCEYVIYSPEMGSVSCLELNGFKDITPYHLAVLIQREPITEEMGEFKFEQKCSKDDLMAFLFNITEKDGSKIKRPNDEGYLLYELTNSKVRNIFIFNSEGEYHLLFENEICYNAIFEDAQTEVINVCWNPIVFTIFENQKNPSYLLPSSNPILSAHIIRIADTKSAKININIGGNYMEVLLFLSFYTHYKKYEKQISVFSDSKQISINLTGWHPVSLVKFISKIQKICNKILNDSYNVEQEIMLYQLKSVGDVSFIVYPNNKLALEIFLVNIINEIKLENLFFCK